MVYGAEEVGNFRYHFTVYHDDLAAYRSTLLCIFQRAFPDCERVSVAMGCDADTASSAPPSQPAVQTAPPDANFKRITPAIERGRVVDTFDYSRKVHPLAASTYFPDYPPAKAMGRAPGYMTARKMLDEYEWTTVADIGSGAGQYSRLFNFYNKTVTSYELGRRYDSSNVTDLVSKQLKSGMSLQYKSVSGNDGSGKPPWRILMGNFMCATTEVYDALWVHHVMEHMLDPHLFTTKLYSMLREGGILALTVPPLKSQIVGGHVSVWIAGLLIQHLVRAGFDCKYLRFFKQAYSLGILLQKRSVPEKIRWKHDRGDICRLMRPYLPIGLEDHLTIKDGCNDAFEGNFRSINWD